MESGEQVNSEETLKGEMHMEKHKFQFESNQVRKVQIFTIRFPPTSDMSPTLRTNHRKASFTISRLGLHWNSSNRSNCTL